ncbi:MAG: lipoyl synthase [bacterium]
MDSFEYSWLDLVPYGKALDLQQRLRERRIADEIPDTLLLLEHPPVVTRGASADDESDFRIPPEQLERRGIQVESISRGGGLTYHGPGQLVVYPIVKSERKDIDSYLRSLEEVLRQTLEAFSITPDGRDDETGVWTGGEKIGSIGVSFRRWVSMHGLALNVDVDCRPFQDIVPCSNPDETMTTMEDKLRRAPMMGDVRATLVEAFADVFGGEALEVEEETPWDRAYADLPDHENRKLLPRRGDGDEPRRKPSWLKAKIPGGENYSNIQNLMDEKMLNTVCEEASCPNLGECWSRGTATFMILGDTCTRACGFCDVKTGTDLDVDTMEPARVARAVQQMELDHTVITSVNRDDLPDGGASIWAKTIKAVRETTPDTSIEVLIPDLMGDWEALQTIFDAEPDILNHNVETVPRLYPTVRPQARYDRSLQLLERSSRAGFPTKSGIMLGIGERRDEIKRTLNDLYDHGVEILTLGQYLRPSEQHLPVDRWVHPEEFDRWQSTAESIGFEHVESGPLVRSSYHADEQVPAEARG